MRSARECLIACIDSWLSPEDAIKLVDDYAHELSEQIRALDPVEAALAGQHAWNDAADVIDPEVQQ